VYIKKFLYLCSQNIKLKLYLPSNLSIMLTENTEQPSCFCALIRGAFLLFFIFLGIEMNAQHFNSTSSYLSNAQQSGMTVVQEQTYRSYQSTIYEPFAAGITSADDNQSNSVSKINNRRNAWDGDGMGDQEDDDPGHRDPESPVGEPWILLLFAAVAAGIVAKKRQIENV
jgi:hypothetical protein